VTPRARRVLALAALAVLAVPLAWGLAGLAPFGHYPGPYGIVMERLVPATRHVTALVTAIVVDVRAFDTLGEEFILFASAVGCTVLLRSRRSELGDPDRREAEVARRPPSFALGALGAAAIGPLTVLGLYVVAHGTVTPGGGFQGGVILVCALLAAYPAGHALRLRRVRGEGAMEAAEALGAAGFAALAVAGLVAGKAALGNVLPLGTPGVLTSGGMMPVANLVIALEVAGALALVLSEFLDEALVQGRQA
jgi:multicomponent Na+:H+ antiporter subunit B